MTQILQNRRWKNLIKILLETRGNPRTLWQEKKNLSDRIERMQNAINENTQSIEVTLQETPYGIQSLIDEMEIIRNTGFQNS